MSRFRVVCAASDVPGVNLDLETEILQEIDAAVIDLRGRPLDQIADELAEADAILTEALGRERFDADRIAGLKRCRVISVYAVGTDGVDVKAAAMQGIAVTYVPTYCSVDVAEHTVTLLLAVWRKLPAAVEIGRKRDWSIDQLRPIRRVAGATIGMIGFGRIAREVAARLLPFGVEVIAHDPCADLATAESLGVRLCSLDELLAVSSAISIHVPLTPATRGLIGAAELAALPHGAVVINVSRGGIVDEIALLAALESGQIAAAGLDVLDIEPPDPSNPLLHHDQVVITPHMAYYSEDSLRDLRVTVARNAALVLTGEPPLWQVNA